MRTIRKHVLSRAVLVAVLALTVFVPAALAATSTKPYHAVLSSSPNIGATATCQPTNVGGGRHLALLTSPSDAVKSTAISDSPFTAATTSSCTGAGVHPVCV